MTETVVHVTTLEQWKSVLDVWFEQGCEWVIGGKNYKEEYFTEEDTRYLNLFCTDISKTSSRVPSEFIEYADFMAQQKEDNKMATVYEVTQSVFDELQRVKAHEGISLIGSIVANAKLIKSIEVGNKAILRYLADDPVIEFKVKEPLYRLVATDTSGQKAYFNKGIYATASSSKNFAFTAPLAEIKKWQTPDWEIEKAD